MRAVGLIVAIIVLVPSLVWCEETLFPKEFTSGYFGGLEVGVTEIGDEVGLVGGVRGGWIINHRAALGANVQMLINDIDFDTTVPDSTSPVDTTLSVMIIYGGAEFTYIHNPERLFHYTASLLVGAGAISYKDYECTLCGEESDLDQDIFFVLEPELTVVVNISSMVRAALGFRYRYVYDVELRGVDNSDLTGASGTLTIKIGRF